VLSVLLELRLVRDCWMQPYRVGGESGNAACDVRTHGGPTVVQVHIVQGITCRMHHSKGCSLGLWLENGPAPQ
jgi:hypothetical protein